MSARHGMSGSPAVPWLTVVTVVRNDPAALRVTLDSVAAQDTSGCEHLIIDGASTDETTELALAAQDATGRVRVVSEPDRGIYDAMNKGWTLARGRLVQYLNAGDVYVGADELAWLRHRIGPDTSWLRTRVRFVDAMGRPARPLDSAAIDPRSFRRGRQAVMHQGAVMSRQLLAGLGGFDTRYRIVGDFDVMCRALAAGVLPDVDDRITVAVDAGGVSTQQWRRSLWESHRCRSEGAPAGARAGSYVATVVRTGEVGLRRGARTAAERLLGPQRVARIRGGTG